MEIIGIGRFTDDTVLVADSEEKLSSLLTEFRWISERRKLKINVEKSKVLKSSVNREQELLKGRLGSEELEEVSESTIFGVHSVRG